MCFCLSSFENVIKKKIFMWIDDYCQTCIYNYYPNSFNETRHKSPYRKLVTTNMSF